MALPSICIITAAAKDDANRVWSAMGRGPENFGVPLTNQIPAVIGSPITHYVSADSSSQASDVAAWQAMQNGDLPPVPPGVVWGENGVIDAASAMAAVTGENLQVYSASGNVTPVEHLNGILQGRALSLIPPEL